MFESQWNHCYLWVSRMTLHSFPSCHLQNIANHRFVSSCMRKRVVSAFFWPCLSGFGCSESSGSKSDSEEVLCVFIPLSSVGRQRKKMLIENKAKPSNFCQNPPGERTCSLTWKRTWYSWKLVLLLVAVTFASSSNFTLKSELIYFAKEKKDFHTPTLLIHHCDNRILWRDFYIGSFERLFSFTLFH